MACLGNIISKSLLHCCDFNSKCPSLNCLVQGILPPDFRMSGSTSTISISGKSLFFYDYRLLSCLLNCNNRIKTTLLIGSGWFGTTIYDVSLIATQQCVTTDGLPSSSITVNIIGYTFSISIPDGSSCQRQPAPTFKSPTGGFERRATYTFIFSCQNDISNPLRENCKDCLIFPLTQSNPTICNIINIPSRKWFDITPYIDRNGLYEQFSYYFLATCRYNNVTFDVNLNIPNINILANNFNISFNTIPALINIDNMCGNLIIKIYTCADYSTVLYTVYQPSGSGIPLSIITGLSINNSQLINIFTAIKGGNL